MALRVQLLILGFICFSWIEGAPRHHHHHKKDANYQNSHHSKNHKENLQSRSYIDIDASDPFKVPKSSQYIDQPVPEFSRPSDDRDEHNDDSEDSHENNDNNDDGNPDDQPAAVKSLDNIQDDLKQMGLENIANSNNDKAPDSNDAPVLDQSEVNGDVSKSIEIKDVDQSLQGLGESNSRQTVPETEEHEGNHDDEPMPQVEEKMSE